VMREGRAANGYKTNAQAERHYQLAFHLAPRKRAFTVRAKTRD
jgi:hypothetical protein